VPKPLKIVLWVLAFVVAAGLGAFVASRSDPFPPGVEDPGARPVATASTTPPATSVSSTSSPSSSPAGSQGWALRMVSKSRHRLHEGGTCTSNWVTTGSLMTVSPSTIEGDAIAELVPPAGCPFAQEQVQTHTMTLRVVGELDGGRIRLSFKEMGRSPAGSQDLGGFVATLPRIEPVLRIADVRDDTVAAAVVPDGGQGSYASVNKVQLVQQGD
jgi:hypothetical protein